MSKDSEAMSILRELVTCFSGGIVRVDADSRFIEIKPEFVALLDRARTLASASDAAPTVKSPDDDSAANQIPNN